MKGLCSVMSFRHYLWVSFQQLFETNSHEILHLQWFKILGEIFCVDQNSNQDQDQLIKARGSVFSRIPLKNTSVKVLVITDAFHQFLIQASIFKLFLVRLLLLHYAEKVLH